MLLWQHPRDQLWDLWRLVYFRTLPAITTHFQFLFLWFEWVATDFEHFSYRCVCFSIFNHKWACCHGAKTQHFVWKHFQKWGGMNIVVSCLHVGIQAAFSLSELKVSSISSVPVVHIQRICGCREETQSRSCSHRFCGITQSCKEQMWVIQALLSSFSTSAAACHLWSKSCILPRNHLRAAPSDSSEAIFMTSAVSLKSTVVLFQRLEIESVKLSRMWSHTDRVMAPSQLLISAADILWSFFFHEGQWSQNLLYLMCLSFCLSVLHPVDAVKRSNQALKPLKENFTILAS